MQHAQQRRLPIGAEVVPGGVHFRVWAPKGKRVEVQLEGGAVGEARGGFSLSAEAGGYFSGIVPSARVGNLYRFRLDGGSQLYPDPASRFQPEGPHGPSQVVDPSTFRWTDGEWRGAGREGAVVYELHIGTFTPEGTFEGARQHLAHLKDLGVTLVEVMPVAEFPGRFGWGYDGVDLFAPTRLYGTPDDFRRFVDAAHSTGLGVILDVVYNHFGPDGNYLREFSDAYFSTKYKNEWGDPLNFDGEDAGPVREFFVANASYWIDEFHLDGLRLDATQQIFDASPQHVLQEVAGAVRRAARGRATFVVGENECQHARLARPVERGGYGLDALWNDDFHHTALVALTGHNEAYYTDYHGTPQEFVSAVKHGFLYQGQRYVWQKARRGKPAFDLPPAAFVLFLENHDQVANSARGLRCHQQTSPGRFRALTALLLLAPGTPMLFQGQEFNATAPFLYFADHNPTLGRAVEQGRRQFLSQFPSVALEAMQAIIAAPADPATFERCKLDWRERHCNTPVLALHRDLLRLRRDDPVLRAQQPRGVDGAVLGPQALVLRFFDAEHGDRLLLVNLGRDQILEPAPEPLLAPPEDMAWSLLWSSEEPKYGGKGGLPPERDGRWRMPGEAAVLLRPVPAPTEGLEESPQRSPQ